VRGSIGSLTWSVCPTRRGAIRFGLGSARDFRFSYASRCVLKDGTLDEKRAARYGAVQYACVISHQMGGRVISNVLRFLLRLMSRARIIYYRSMGVNIEGNGRLHRISIPRNWADITLEYGVALDAGVTILCNGPPKRDKIRIGSGTYINRGTILDARNKLHIGRNVMIGPNCYFTDANHGTAPGSSVKSQPMQLASLIIEDEAWIGAHVVILPGVRIGKGAVIGAGAVVTRDVPGETIAHGVPARVTRHRLGHLALLIAANVIVATITWYVVELFL
jgi:acetyltransferase-like isoleucine patch superfamily enzyme